MLGLCQNREAVTASAAPAQWRPNAGEAAGGLLSTTYLHRHLPTRPCPCPRGAGRWHLVNTAQMHSWVDSNSNPSPIHKEF